MESVTSVMQESAAPPAKADAKESPLPSPPGGMPLADSKSLGDKVVDLVRQFVELAKVCHLRISRPHIEYQVGEYKLSDPVIAHRAISYTLASGMAMIAPNMYYMKE